MVDRDASNVGLLTASQVARKLNICERSVFSLTKSGELPAVRLGRAVRYALEDVASFILRNKDGAEAEHREEDDRGDE